MLRTSFASSQKAGIAGAEGTTRKDVFLQVPVIVNKIIFKEGDVLAAGENIMEIVPLNDALVIEAKVRSQDIASIELGQKATIRVISKGTTLVGVDAIVEQISTEPISNGRGDVFFLVKVSSRGSAYHDKNTVPILAGMDANVEILTGEQTVISYLLKQQ